MNLRTLALGALLVVLVGPGTGLTGGCAFGRSAARHADDVPLPLPHEAPRVPHVPVPADDAAAVTAREEKLLVPVADLYAEERQLVIDVACGLKTGYDLGAIEDETEFAQRAAAELGGDTTKGRRAAYLAYDLISADNLDDAVGQAAVAAVCGV